MALGVGLLVECSIASCADPENFLRGGGGVQIPRRGLTENFNIAKINNMAFLGGGGGPDPLSPTLDPPMCMVVVRGQLLKALSTLKTNYTDFICWKKMVYLLFRQVTFKW